VGIHPPGIKQAALELIAAGHNDCEVARRLRIPRRTIMDWRRPRYVPRREYPLETCPRCWQAAKPIRFTEADYADLLGLYLGDGCISRTPRAYRLRIALDNRYPRIIRDARCLLERCFPENRVDVVQRTGCVNVSMYSLHLPCLLPQHGPGRKHERTIVLEHWQSKILAAEPWSFIRACIRTDGCVFINRTDIHQSVPNEYLSYQFSNKSQDIADLFVAACNRVGVATRMNRDGRGRWSVRINRRVSVALMLAQVGVRE
jgi:Homeodomain-like domain